MGAAPIGVDRPRERHGRFAGHVVQGALRSHLVKVSPGNSGTWTLRSRPRIPTACPAASSGPRRRVAAHPIAWPSIRTHVRTHVQFRSAGASRRGSTARPSSGSSRWRPPGSREQVLERVRRRDPHLQDVGLVAGHRVAGLDRRDVRQSLRRSSGWDASIGLIEMNAVTGRPTPAASIFAMYPLIRPRFSSRFTRWCTAEIDRAGLLAELGVRPGRHGRAGQQRAVDVHGRWGVSAGLSRRVRRVHGDRRSGC